VSNPFRNRSNLPRLSAEEAARQGAVSKLAFERLRQPAAVMAFLNTHNEALGGRPLDVAIATPDGLTRVEAAIAGLASA
jgi:hypothetical protein